MGLEIFIRDSDLCVCVFSYTFFGGSIPDGFVFFFNETGPTRFYPFYFVGGLDWFKRQNIGEVILT